MVDYPIGDVTPEGVRAKEGTPFYSLFASDGVTGPNVATFCSDQRRLDAAAPLRTWQVQPYGSHPRHPTTSWDMLSG
jgi:hypothetical protein